MHETIEPCGSAGPVRQNVGAKSLRENCATTGRGVASKRPYHDNELNLPTCQRKIDQKSTIMAMDAGGYRATLRRTVREDHHGLEAVLLHHAPQLLI